MDLRPRNKIDASFSLASMTDIIFQLLIFFMLTSSLVAPSALPVNLPSTTQAPVILPKIRVTLTKDLNYYLNDQPVATDQLEERLKDALAESREKIVVINIDKEVTVEHLIYITSLTNQLNAKISIATKLEGNE